MFQAVYLLWRKAIIQRICFVVVIVVVIVVVAVHCGCFCRFIGFVHGVVSSLAFVAVVFIDCPRVSSFNLFLLQVLPVVNEQNRYGGEMTGIRAHLTRSIKIK